MMNNIHIALWIVCLFDAIILLCLPSAEKVFFSTDGSAARYVVDFISLGIGIFVLFKNGWDKLPSKAIGFILLAMIISHFHAPNIQFNSSFLPNDHAIFDYKPMFEAILFFMLFMGVYSLRISSNSKHLIRKSLVWISTIYAGFAILQRFGLDQFYKLAGPTIHMSRNPEVGGFISQPVFCAALIAICMPFIFRYGKLWQAAVCLLGILATGNRSALITIIICALFITRYKFIAKFLIGIYVSYLILGVFNQFHLINSNLFGEERFTIWKEIITDFTTPAFPGINNSQILTGTGIGSFSVIFPFYHNNGYYQAHNEILETLRTVGIFGLISFMLIIKGIPKFDKALVSALLASFLLSLTNPIWHIPQLAFLTVFILALAYKTGDRNVADS